MQRKNYSPSQLTSSFITPIAALILRAQSHQLHWGSAYCEIKGVSSWRVCAIDNLDICSKLNLSVLHYRDLKQGKIKAICLRQQTQFEEIECRFPQSPGLKRRSLFTH